MNKQTKPWGAIIVMIALFAMIAFVTNLCSPMANIIKAQGEISEVLAQIGNYGNFVAYLLNSARYKHHGPWHTQQQQQLR